MHTELNRGHVNNVEIVRKEINKMGYITMYCQSYSIYIHACEKLNEKTNSTPHKALLLHI